MSVLPYLFCFLLFRPGAYIAQPQLAATTPNAASMALDAVRTSSKLDAPLEATPEHALADDVIFLKTQGVINPKESVPIIEFYKVGVARYVLEDHHVLSQSAEVDSTRAWLVAVDSSNHQTFLLFGGDHSAQNFNSLIADIGIRVTDAEMALSVFDFYLKTVLGEGYRSEVVTDEMGLESVALKDFRQRYPESQRRRAFQSWRKSISADTLANLKRPTARSINSGFEITYFLYDAGSIQKQTLYINGNGGVTNMASLQQGATSK
jgi:hypothetical protein